MDASQFVIPSCFCGESAQIKTSWTDSSSGRRFLGCKNYGVVGACGFFQWFDPLVGDRAKIIIIGLLRKSSKMEDELKQVKKRRIYLWFFLGNYNPVMTTPELIAQGGATALKPRLIGEYHPIHNSEDAMFAIATTHKVSHFLVFNATRCYFTHLSQCPCSLLN
uniref:GRF-type domain-containing protein n=1 Tax=Ananas comosus var. bracteatus TaxID=296719 RepID=A0A6V7Q6B7_ANACO|nr:unnamed protein product [Ananas comosus var. bracteatus]